MLRFKRFIWILHQEVRIRWDLCLKKPLLHHCNTFGQPEIIWVIGWLTIFLVVLCAFDIILPRNSFSSLVYLSFLNTSVCAALSFLMIIECLDDYKLLLDIISVRSNSTDPLSCLPNDGVGFHLIGGVY